MVSGGNGDNHNCEYNWGSRGDYGGGNDASRQNCGNIGKGSSKRSGLCGVKDYDGGGDSRDGGTNDSG